MAFTEVKSLEDMKTEYRAMQRKYDNLKYQFLNAIRDEDFEVTGVEAFLELKEMYILTNLLYWKIHSLENPEDKATEKAYRFLNSMSRNDSNDFLMQHGLTTHELIEKIKENPNYIEEVTA